MNRSCWSESPWIRGFSTANRLSAGGIGGRTRPGMLAAGDTIETILEGYPWLEMEDVRACLVYARRLVGHERIEPLLIESGQ